MKNKNMKDYILDGLVTIEWNGSGYYYTTTKGGQLSKAYKTVARLKRYGKINHTNAPGHWA